MNTSSRNKLLKVLVYRVLSMLVAVAVSWAYLGSFVKSAGLTLILTVLMTAAHYAYEAAWERWCSHL